jgi:hypothetical protein
MVDPRSTPQCQSVGRTSWYPPGPAGRLGTRAPTDERGAGNQRKAACCRMIPPDCAALAQDSWPPTIGDCDQTARPGTLLMWTWKRPSGTSRHGCSATASCGRAIPRWRRRSPRKAWPRWSSAGADMDRRTRRTRLSLRLPAVGRRVRATSLVGRGGLRRLRGCLRRCGPTTRSLQDPVR